MCLFFVVNDEVITVKGNNKMVFFLHELDCYSPLDWIHMDSVSFVCLLSGTLLFSWIEAAEVNLLFLSS